MTFISSEMKARQYELIQWDAQLTQVTAQQISFLNALAEANSFLPALILQSPLAQQPGRTEEGTSQAR